MKVVKHSNEITFVVNYNFKHYRIPWSNGLHGLMMLSLMYYNLMKLVHNSLKLPVNSYLSGHSIGTL